MRKDCFVAWWQLMGVLGAIILCLGALPLMATPITFTGTNGTASTATQATGDSPVSEPAIMLLLGCGLIGLAGYGRKIFSKK